jgi:hypothetical protein
MRVAADVQTLVKVDCIGCPPPLGERGQASIVMAAQAQKLLYGMRRTEGGAEVWIQRGQAPVFPTSIVIETRLTPWRLTGAS